MAVPSGRSERAVAGSAGSTWAPGESVSAEAAHGEHDKRPGHRLKAELAERVRDEDWPAWYASYIAAEQAGTALPT